MTSQQLEDLDCHVILGNTYHLESRPGSDLVAELGGLHDFISWPRAMLTDSGGFQVRYSLQAQCVLCCQTSNIKHQSICSRQPSTFETSPQVSLVSANAALLQMLFQGRFEESSLVIWFLSPLLVAQVRI